MSLLAAPILFTACKRQFSSDNALSPTYIPSIIINSDNQILYGINPATGIRNWQYSLPLTSGTPIPGIAFQPSPLLYHECIYLPGTQNLSFQTDTLYKINSETGALISKFVFAPGVFFNVQATPIASGNLIFIPATNDTLYAIDTGTGKTQWKYGTGTAGAMISSPVIYHDTLYGATTGGLVYALATTQSPATTGGPVSADWTYTAPTGGAFYSSPAVSAPYLYIGSVNDSNMYCIYLQPTTAGSASGNLRWTYKTNGGIYSSPAAEYGICVFGSNDFNVYCLDTSLPTTIGGAIISLSPYPRWITPTHSAVRSSPVVVNSVVYIGSYDYNLYAINVANGSVKWTFASTALIKSSPLVYGTDVYIGSYDKYLYEVDTASGTLRWSYNTNGQIECSPVVDDLSGINQFNSQISGYTN